MAKNNQNIKIDEKYIAEYSDDSLFSMLSHYAKKLGKEVVSNVLILYKVLKSPKTNPILTPLIISALGYLIMPFDLIPDFLPVAGFSDDISVLTAIITAISSSITPQIRKEVEKDIKEYFD